MFFSRPTPRKAMVAWLLTLVMLLAAPQDSLARIWKADGRDGAEGDPGDGLETVGGGSLDGLSYGNINTISKRSSAVPIPGIIDWAVIVVWFPQGSLVLINDNIQILRIDQRRAGGNTQ